MKKLKVNLIAGFLGSGKTAVLRNFLSQAKLQERVAVLVHDLAELRLDDRVVKRTPGSIELDNGAICRQFSKNFAEDLRSMSRLGTERVLIEASGSADPGKVLNILLETDLHKVYRVEPTIVVVDVSAFERLVAKVAYPYVMHIKAADILLLNKVDQVPADTARRVENQLKKLNPRAFLMSTKRGKIDLLGILEGKANAPEVPSPDQPHFEYCTVLMPGVFDRLKLEAFFLDLPDTVYRAKGYVYFSTGPHLVNFVAGNFEYEPVAHEGDNELVFIGSDVPRSRITAGVKKCVKDNGSSKERS